jgi:hypothetical protein
MSYRVRAIICLGTVLAVIATTNSASAGEASSGEIKTGNKPSTFNYRINPYIRHNTLENGAEGLSCTPSRGMASTT